MAVEISQDQHAAPLPDGSPRRDWIVGKNALLSLRAVIRNGRTEVDPVARRIPFQYQGVHYQDHDDQPFVLLHNSGGGFVEGDSSFLTVDARAETRTLLTTMGATKFYKSVTGAMATEWVALCVGENALLEYLPDEVIPYAHSRCERMTRIVAAPSARLFVSDVLAAGRVHFGAGEEFAFDLFTNTHEVQVGDALLFRDHAQLSSQDRGALLRLWGGKRYCATVVAYAPTGLGVLTEEAAHSAREVEGVVAGASNRERLLCIRILAEEAWSVHEAVFRVWSVVRPTIAGKPAREIRKC